MALKSLGLRIGRASPPERCVVLISVRNWDNSGVIMELKGLNWKKIYPMASSGIETTAFWLVTQHLTNYTIICSWLNGRCMAVTLVAGFPPRRPGFEPGSGHVGFVIDKAVLGQIFPGYSGFLCQSFHRLLHTYDPSASLSLSLSSSSSSSGTGTVGLSCLSGLGYTQPEKGGG
jgi:hypothetical protein